MGTKLSELARVSSIANNDLLETSKSIGGGYTSYGITLKDFKSSIYSSRTVFVSADNTGDATNLKDGLVVAAALTPTQNSPVIIYITPGTYNEDNPVQMIPWVTVESWGGTFEVLMVADNTNQPIILGATNSGIDGIHFNGAYDTGGIAVSMLDAGRFSISNCDIDDCDTGVYVNNANVKVSVDGVRFIKYDGYIARVGLQVDSGHIVTTNCRALNCDLGGVEKIGIGIYANGANADIYAPNTPIGDCDIGIMADNGGIVNHLASKIYNCGDALKIGNTGSNSEINCTGCEIEDSITYNFHIESSTGKIRYQGLSTTTASNVASGAILQTIQLDEDENRAFVRADIVTPQSLKQGVAGDGGLGTYTVLGSGGPYTTDEYNNTIVEFWQYDSNAVSGSRFTQYANCAGTQLTGDGDAIIIGSKCNFSQLVLSIDTIANVGSNSLTMDYWNGAAWTECTFCGYDFINVDSRGKSIFVNSEIQIIEADRTADPLMGTGINVLDEIPNWNTAISMYALRIRNDGALVTGAIFSGCEADTDNISIDADSNKIAKWGKFRGDNTVFRSAANFMASDDYVPTSSTLNISPNVNVTLPYIRFDYAVKSMSILEYVLNDSFDTASPLKITVAFKIVTNPTIAASNINFKIIVSTLRQGNVPVILDGTATETTYDASYDMYPVALGMVTGLLLGAQTSIDLSDYESDDAISIAILRDPADILNTFTGNVDIIGAFLTNGLKIV